MKDIIKAVHIFIAIPQKRCYRYDPQYVEDFIEVKYLFDIFWKIYLSPVDYEYADKDQHPDTHSKKSIVLCIKSKQPLYHDYIKCKES